MQEVKDFVGEPPKPANPLRQVCNGLITIAIRARFEYDSATTRYNTLRGFSFARIRIVYENQW